MADWRLRRGRHYGGHVLGSGADHVLLRSPSAHVTQDAFERIVKVNWSPASPPPGRSTRLSRPARLDVTETSHDVEGAILARVRNVIGAISPLDRHLDLHGQLNAGTGRPPDALTPTAPIPHIDMAENRPRGREAYRANC